MEYLDRQRFTMLTRKIIRLFERKSRVAITDRTDATKRKLTAMQLIEKSYADSWHRDKVAGHPICTQMRNATSADAYSLTHGGEVWTTDVKGRIIKGRAFYNINNMWWVVLNRYERVNRANFELFVGQPDRLREKRNHRLRVKSIERAMRAAAANGDTARAEVLKRLRLGGGEPCRIWSRKEKAYYGTGFSGYQTSRAEAGIYTREEAENECRRVPHILSLETPDGLRLTFEGEAA
ncbi:hypothetical protein [Tateyamaria omphalii]|uniref:hypothetical protein n=1 Tax=Tateyamaria omphalii TaxID=299262 RepID=UPI00167A692F|nr:hypothetical protein [Tateyamaria omphalii]